jgi:hypothetical protein
MLSISFRSEAVMCRPVPDADPPADLAAAAAATGFGLSWF